MNERILSMGRCDCTEIRLTQNVLGKRRENQNASSESGPRHILTLLIWCRLLFIRKEHRMRNEFTSVIEEDGEWFIGYCPEIPGANGQGRTVEECRANLADAIALILEDRREDGLRGVPQDAIRDTVVVQ